MTVCDHCKSAGETEKIVLQVVSGTARECKADLCGPCRESSYAHLHAFGFRVDGYKPPEPVAESPVVPESAIGDPESE